MNVKLALLFVAVTTAHLGCADTRASCWPAVEEEHDRLFNILQDEQIDQPRLSRTRKDLARALRNCDDDEPFFHRSSDVYIGSEYVVSMLDVAVISDEADLVQHYFGKLQGIGPTNRSVDELLYGAAHLNVAAYFQARESVRQLLELGAEPNAVSSKGATALHSARIVDADGMRMMRDLVQSGANVDMQGAKGFTPIMAARANGDLVKAQCLQTLGADAPAPLPDDFSVPDKTLESSIRRVDEFLRSPARSIPDEILELCSID